MTTVKDIAKILANKYSMSNVEAEIFMQMIVEVINDGLLKDRQVKIKGFGTFKIQTVKERNSVNINTGEKVVIAEHDKITFTPDTLMKDLINKPFAQFETVVVDDDSPLLNTNNEIDETNISSEEDSSLETEGNDNNNNNVDDRAVLPVEENEEKTEENTTNYNIKEEGTAKTEDSEEENDKKVNNNGVEADSEETISEEINEERNHINIEDKKENQINSDEQEEDCERQYLQCRNIFIYYGILINVIVATIAFTLGYMASSNKWFADEEDVVMMQQASKHVKKTTNQNKENVLPSKPSAVKDTIKSNSTIVGKQEVTNEVDKKEVEKNKMEVVANKDEREECPPLHAYDNDIRVKTGAYYIMGTEKTVTVKPGQTLTSISRTYLGEGMECYIEAYNGKKEVKQGDRIKIPKLKLKKLVNKK